MLKATPPSPSFLSRERTVAAPGFNRWLVPPAETAGPRKAWRRRRANAAVRRGRGGLLALVVAAWIAAGALLTWGRLDHPAKDGGDASLSVG